MEAKTFKASDFLEMEFSDRDVIASDLESAARILRDHNDGSRDDSASWRIADAGLRLRMLIEKSGDKDIPGVDIPTGFGALLPSKVPLNKPPTAKTREEFFGEIVAGAVDTWERQKMEEVWRYVENRTKTDGGFVADTEWFQQFIDNLPPPRNDPHK